jgi:hypothetical protein
MRADYRVLLDACVLMPMPLADTLLRMAEAPRLYLPKWSQMIMGEVTRNLVNKWNMEPAKARRREEEIRRHFPEAWVDGFEPLNLVNSRINCEWVVKYRRGARAMTKTIQKGTQRRLHRPAISIS